MPAGAFAQGATVTMQSAGVFPAPTSNTGPLIGTGAGVQISAGGVQPSISPKLTLGYTPGATITDAQELVIAYYDPVDAVWVPLPSTVNTTADTVTAAIPHFSTYQIMQEAPASSLSSAHILIFPNPVYTSRGQQMSFTGLPAGASLTVYTFRGDKVRAFDAARTNVAITKNEYQAGTVDFTTVSTAEATALAAQNALVQVQASRLSTAVNLIEALGGGWNAASLPKS